MSLRVGMVDDHPAFILGLSTFLNAQHEIQVVAGSTSVRGLIDERIRLELVLLDLHLGDGSTPADNIERLATLNAAIVGVTAGQDPDLVREAVEAGAVGVVGKFETPARIVDVIRRLSRADGPVEGEDEPDPPVVFDLASLRLTEREADVLALYATGQTADLVANALFISRDTVNDHIRRIRVKYAALGRSAPTRVDLFKRAVEDGLVPPHL